ncbi:MAG TPA: hypothetical protein VNO79_08760 [Actinomycetota bacterium]|nr:hypothetical protein [Actinomycetota bacterium]
MASSTGKRRGPVYHLEEPCRVETCTPLGERFEVTFEAGDHEPRSEREEIALEHLYVCGLATRDGQPFGARPVEEA